MSHLALARQWRPKNFSQVVGQPYVIQALTNAINQSRLHHAYLFTGTRGVGKTTIARILAKCLNCETGITATPCDRCDACTSIDAGRFPDLFEIDAASRTKVEDTRDILDNVQYAPTVGRFKIYLIDEVHMLSTHSFNALLKTLEEPPEHIKFLLATTDPQKLPVTVLSRCLQFHLSLVTEDDIAHHLSHILTAEQIDHESAALSLIATAAKGSVRDALSLLDQCIAFGNSEIKTAQTRQLLGVVDDEQLVHILQALQEQDGNRLIELTQTLYQQGADFSHVLDGLLSTLHTIARAQLAKRPTGSETLDQLANVLPKEDVQLFYQIGLIGQRDLPLAPTPQTGFEMTLLRMLAFIPTTATHQAPQMNPSPKARSTSKPASPTAPAEPTPPPTQTKDWHQLFESLNLRGAARMLAEQCTLESQTDERITLAMSVKHKALHQEALIQRLRQAITDHYQRPIELLINLTDNTPNDTPHQAAVQAKSDQQTAAEKQIYGDDKVQQIIKAFDAKILKDSIKPVDQNGD